MKWFLKVKPGDKLQSRPEWNNTERPSNQLINPVEVLRVTEAQSQSGMLFTVRTRNGMTRELDAGWFIEPNAKVSGVPPQD